MFDSDHKLSLALEGFLSKNFGIESENFLLFLKAYYEWLETTKLTLVETSGTFIRGEEVIGTFSNATGTIREVGIGYIAVEKKNKLAFDQYETVRGLGSNATAKINQVKDNVIRASAELPNYRKLDSSVGDYFAYLKEELFQTMPQEYLGNKRLIASKFRDFFQSRSNEQSYRFLFKLLYDETIDFYYPGDDILRISDGNFEQQRIVRTRVNSRIFEFVNKTIRGVTSGAIGNVVTARTSFSGGIEYAEFVLNLVNGTFLPEEEIVATTDSTLKTTLFGIVTGFNIVDGGSGYQVGNNIVITGDGFGAQAQILSVQQSPIDSLAVNEKGQGYRLGVNGIVDDTGTGGSGLKVRVTELANTYYVSTPIVGTVNVQTGSNTVTGNFTTFFTSFSNGDFLEIGTRAYQVVGRDSNTLIRVFPEWKYESANDLTANLVQYTIGETSKVDVINRGSNYFESPSITLVDTLVGDLGMIDEKLIVITDGGFDYRVGDTLTFTGNNPTRHAIGQVASVEEIIRYRRGIINDFSSEVLEDYREIGLLDVLDDETYDFLLEDSTRVIFENGKDILKNEEWDFEGSIARVELLDMGRGYDTVNALPTIEVTSANGTGAVLTVSSLSGLNAEVSVDAGNNSVGLGSIRALNILDFGLNYSNASVDLTELGDGNANLQPIISGLGITSGIWVDDDGKIDYKIIQDSFFYQDYSYVIRSGLVFNVYRDALKRILHPAGMIPFGEIQISSYLNVEATATSILVLRNIQDYLIKIESFFSAAPTLARDTVYINPIIESKILGFEGQRVFYRDLVMEFFRETQQATPSPAYALPEFVNPGNEDELQATLTISGRPLTLQDWRYIQLDDVYYYQSGGLPARVSNFEKYGKEVLLTGENLVSQLYIDDSIVLEDGGLLLNENDVGRNQTKNTISQESNYAMDRVRREFNISYESLTEVETIPNLSDREMVVHVESKKIDFEREQSILYQDLTLDEYRFALLETWRDKIIDDETRSEVGYDETVIRFSYQFYLADYASSLLEDWRLVTIDQAFSNTYYIPGVEANWFDSPGIRTEVIITPDRFFIDATGAEQREIEVEDQIEIPYAPRTYTVVNEQYKDLILLDHKFELIEDYAAIALDTPYDRPIEIDFYHPDMRIFTSTIPTPITVESGITGTPFTLATTREMIVHVEPDVRDVTFTVTREFEPTFEILVDNTSTLRTPEYVVKIESQIADFDAETDYKWGDIAVEDIANLLVQDIQFVNLTDVYPAAEFFDDKHVDTEVIVKVEPAVLDLTSSFVREFKIIPEIQLSSVVTMYSEIYVDGELEVPPEQTKIYEIVVYSEALDNPGEYVIRFEPQVIDTTISNKISEFRPIIETELNVAANKNRLTFTKEIYSEIRDIGVGAPLYLDTPLDDVLDVPLDLYLEDQMDDTYDEGTIDIPFGRRTATEPVIRLEPIVIDVAPTFDREIKVVPELNLSSTVSIYTEINLIVPPGGIIVKTIESTVYQEAIDNPGEYVIKLEPQVIDVAPSYSYHLDYIIESETSTPVSTSTEVIRPFVSIVRETGPEAITYLDSVLDDVLDLVVGTVFDDQVDQTYDESGTFIGFTKRETTETVIKVEPYADVSAELDRKLQIEVNPYALSTLEISSITGRNVQFSMNAGLTSTNSIVYLQYQDNTGTSIVSDIDVAIDAPVSRLSYNIESESNVAVTPRTEVVLPLVSVRGDLPVITFGEVEVEEVLDVALSSVLDNQIDGIYPYSTFIGFTKRGTTETIVQVAPSKFDLITNSVPAKTVATYVMGANTVFSFKGGTQTIPLGSLPISDFSDQTFDDIGSLTFDGTGETISNAFSLLSRNVLANGTVTITGTSVVGTDTDFTSQFSINSSLIVGNEKFIVTNIANSTFMEINVAATGSYSGSQAYREIS